LVRPRPGSSTAIGVSSAKSFAAAKRFVASLACSGSNHQQAPPTQFANVERSSSMPWRAKIRA
jgi:hypothetical protein